MGWAGGKKSTKPWEIRREIHRTWPERKAIPHSSTPSWEQRTVSSHCGFGVLDKVMPFILIFQACYLPLVPPVPNNRPKFDTGRFVAVGEKSGTASCPPVSPLGGNRPIPTSRSALNKAESQTVIRHSECKQSRALSPHTQRGTRPPEMQDQRDAASEGRDAQNHQPPTAQTQAA